jgi:hypothetical protein
MRKNLITAVSVKYAYSFQMVRTFPKALSTFRDIVNERGARLRKLPFEELARLGETPIEHLSVESRPATIGIIVEPLPSGGIRVVVQGFMKAKLLGQSVALDGFYKNPDGTVAPMPNEEFYEFD